MNLTDEKLAACMAADARNLESLMERTLGQRRMSWQIQLPFGIIYSLLLLLGVSGNLCTCVVIARTKCLHTITNLYLFSLAISDLSLLLTGIPHELYSTLVEQYPWYLGPELCRMRNFLAELTPAVSVLTITCFTVERYIAIAHPLRAQMVSSFKRTVLIIMSIWLMAATACLPVGFASRPVAYANYPSLNATEVPSLPHSCPEPDWANQTGQPVPQSVVCHCADAALCSAHFQVSGLVFFVVPMCIITVLYVLIAFALGRSNSLSSARRRNDADNAGASGGGSSHDRRSKNSVIRMLVVIVVTFFVCWAPFHLQRLLGTYKVLAYLPSVITNVLYYCSGSLFYISSTLNPIFYNLMSAKFRQGFRSVFCCSPGQPTGWNGGAGTGFGGGRTIDTKSQIANHTMVSKTNGLSPSSSLYMAAAMAAAAAQSSSSDGLITAQIDSHFLSVDSAHQVNLRLCSVVHKNCGESNDRDDDDFEQDDFATEVGLLQSRTESLHEESTL